MMRHWTCRFKAGPVAQIHSQEDTITVSELKFWVLDLSF